jgi:hypothetical protein
MTKNTKEIPDFIEFLEDKGEENSTVMAVLLAGQYGLASECYRQGLKVVDSTQFQAIKTIEQLFAAANMKTDVQKQANNFLHYAADVELAGKHPRVGPK